MKITLVTDTWDNTNGVATTLKNTVKNLIEMGHEVQVIEPSQFKTIKAPSYPEVRLSLNIWRVGPMISKFDPDAIHIATEGPLGFAARWYCKVDKRSIPHNTSYHTKFPEYFNTYFGTPVEWGYWFIRWFHKFSTKVLVTNEAMRDELSSKNFKRLEVWSRGVDRDLFNTSYERRDYVKRPMILCVSRASKEKGLDDYCSLNVEGTKVLVGDGPYLNELKKKYLNDVEFVGYKNGRELAEYYASADVTVFPSKSDTFGVVMLESIACGTPVAAYPVIGPTSVILEKINGSMNEDLEVAVKEALGCDRSKVYETSLTWDWKKCTETFLKNLTIIEKNNG